MPPTAAPPATLFRSHRYPDEADATSAVVIYRQLAHEWSRLVRSPAVQSTLRRWARSEPALAGHADLGALLDAIDTANPPGTDELLHALVRLFHSGQQLAGRTVLQAMLPKLAALARGRRDITVSLEDRCGDAIATFWQVLAGPAALRRTHKVAANLALDTLHQLTDAGRAHASEDVCNPFWFESSEHAPRLRPVGATTSTSTGVDELINSGALTADGDVDDLLEWGLRTRVITHRDSALLAAVYTRDNRRIADVASDLGVTPSALRQRSSRATRVLIAAVHNEMQNTTAASLAEFDLAS